MKSWTYDRYGTPDVLRLVDAPVPTPGPGEVVVRVRAASINSKDWRTIAADPWMLKLMLRGLRGPRDGLTPGSDFAGTVHSIGADVQGLASGNEVFGYVSSGTFAEYVRVPATSVAPKPQGLPFDDAAAVPLAGVTALRAVRDVAGVSPGQRVLINGASGGVGTFSVQIAKALGAAHVTAVCSGRNAALIRATGADATVDYAARDVTRLAEQFDVVIDIAGGLTLRGIQRITRRGAIVAMTGGNGGRILGPLARIARWSMFGRLFGLRPKLVTVAVERRDLDDLTALIDAEAIRPVIDETYPFSAIPDAMRYFATGHVRAKVVVTV